MTTHYAAQTVDTDARVIVKRISMSAVFAGVVFAMVVHLLLTLLGAGIGLSTVDPPAQGETPSAAAFGTGAGMWWTVSSLIALFIGGWAAGRLAGVPRKSDAALHGLLTWGVSTLLLLYFVSSTIGPVLGGVFNVAGTAVTAAVPQAAHAVSQNNAAGPAGRPGEQLLSDPEIKEMAGRLVRERPDAANREDAINLLAERSGMSREEAERTVANLEQKYQRTAQQTKGTAAAARTQLPNRRCGGSLLSSSAQWSPRSAASPAARRTC